jgi:SAM-dependent methyltransferase
MKLSRQYAKLCDLRDFDDPALRAAIRDVIAARPADEEVERKFWEFAMLVGFLHDVDALREDAEILAVGAGSEEPLFWLANRVKRVVATDIYGEGEFAYREAKGTMLTDPTAFAPYPYREDHLDVRWMDARKLEFPDATFDAVFTLSSIEHFGSPGDIGRSAREIGRVLKPGGHAFVVTECLLGDHPMDWPLVNTAIRVLSRGQRCPDATPRNRQIDAFTHKELQPRIVAPSGLKLMQPLNLQVSRAGFDNAARLFGDGRLEYPTGRRHPHVVVRGYGAPWTSVCLPLEKPA